MQFTRFFTLLLILVIGSTLLAQDTVDVNTFNDETISFDYPADWDVDATDERIILTQTTDDDTPESITFYPATTVIENTFEALDLDSVLSSFLETLEIDVSNAETDGTQHDQVEEISVDEATEAVLVEEEAKIGVGTGDVVHRL